MKYVLSASVILLSLNVFAQHFQVSQEGREKILKGFISRADISSDTSFTWFVSNRKGYTPNASAVQAFREKGAEVQVIAFGGTWCEDTKYILPRFYSLLEAAGFPEDRITLIGVDRNKKTLSHLAEALQVEYVPTFIIMKNGKELGRVVEYGKTGAWDKELGDILNSLSAN